MPYSFYEGTSLRVLYARGSIYTTIMELGPQNHNGDGLLGPNSIIVVYMDPLGIQGLLVNLKLSCGIRFELSGFWLERVGF